MLGRKKPHIYIKKNNSFWPNIIIDDIQMTEAMGYFFFPVGETPQS